ncbi:MAG: hypothetical protein ACLGGX_09750 [Bdellovibrionia bacterium]
MVAKLPAGQEHIPVKNRTISIAKNDQGFYSIEIKEHTPLIDKRRLDRANPIYNIVESGKLYLLTRTIQIPIQIEAKQQGIIASYEKSFKSDVDVKTNSFSNFSGQTVADLFGEYKGSAWNLGVVIIGAGYTRLKNENGIRMGEFNGVFPPPATLNIGINAGLTAAFAQVKLVPLNQDIIVNYELEVRDIKQERLLMESEQEIKTLEEILDQTI